MQTSRVLHNYYAVCLCTQYQKYYIHKTAWIKDSEDYNYSSLIWHGPTLYGNIAETKIKTPTTPLPAIIFLATCVLNY